MAVAAEEVVCLSQKDQLHSSHSESNFQSLHFWAYLDAGLAQFPDYYFFGNGDGGIALLISEQLCVQFLFINLKNCTSPAPFCKYPDIGESIIAALFEQ